MMEFHWRCARCGAMAPVATFSQYQTICDTCVQRERTQDIKVCIQCGEIKPKTAFSIHKAAVDGHRRVCKYCADQEKTARVAAAPPRTTISDCFALVRRKFGSDALLQSDYGRRTLDREIAQLTTHAPFKFKLRARLIEDDRNGDDPIPGAGVATIWEWNHHVGQPCYRIYLPEPPTAEVAQTRARQREWARAILAAPDSWAILDTETTGLEDDCDIIEIAFLDPAGKLLYTNLVRSTTPIPLEVINKTGIREAQVARANGFATIYQLIRPLLASRSLLVYNAEFDVARLQRQIQKYCGQAWSPLRAECLMLAYAAFRGERHGPKSKFAGEYVHWKLSEACVQMRVELGIAHRALADCRQSLALLQAMAQ